MDTYLVLVCLCSSRCMGHSPVTYVRRAQGVQVKDAPSVEDGAAALVGGAPGIILGAPYTKATKQCTPALLPAPHPSHAACSCSHHTATRTYRLPGRVWLVCQTAGELGGDKAAEAARRNVWFARQIGDCSCAVQALLCVLMNTPADAAVELGSKLEVLRMHTRVEGCKDYQYTIYRNGQCINSNKFLLAQQEKVGTKAWFRAGAGSAGIPPQESHQGRKLHHFSALVVHGGPCCGSGYLGCCKRQLSPPTAHPTSGLARCSCNAFHMPDSAACTGRLYELDGLQKLPVCLGDATSARIEAGACTDATPRMLEHTPPRWD